MIHAPWFRLVVLPVAAIVTVLLFRGMGWLISADFEEPDNLREYNLESITPEAQEENVTRRARSKPRKLNNADKPPPPPKLTASKSDIDLPTPNIQGADRKSVV